LGHTLGYTLGFTLGYTLGFTLGYTLGYTIDHTFGHTLGTLWATFSQTNLVTLNFASENLNCGTSFQFSRFRGFSPPLKKKLEFIRRGRKWRETKVETKPPKKSCLAPELQDFSGCNIPKWLKVHQMTTKYTKWSYVKYLCIPIGRKIDQMTTKYTKWP
jgi:hypothetical protein